MSSGDKTSENYLAARKNAYLKEHLVSDQSYGLQPGAYSSCDDTWNIDKFRKNLKIDVVNHTKTEMEFDIIGVDPAVANCFRRIMLSEVPSIAFEKVFLYNNTSIIQDEVLAHRLGLIPVKADPRLFEYRKEGDLVGSEVDTLEFELKIKCSWNPKRSPDAADPDEMYLNHKVYSSHLKWLPMGNQRQKYKATDVGPVHDDILIAKLRPGHELDMKLQAVKGIGKDHAKFSPVGTAFYRLLPAIEIKEPIEGERAERFQKCFSPGVIKLVNIKGKNYAAVNNARYDSCSRNVFRFEDLAQTVTLTRVKDHFIFTVESIGAITPHDIFLEAGKVLTSKCKKFLNEITRGVEYD